MREIEVDGDKVFIVPDLTIHEYLRTWCPKCEKVNWLWRGRDDFSAFKCWNCGVLYMDDNETILDIVEHEGLDYEECQETPYPDNEK